MRILKYISLIVIALFCINVSFAWLDPPTDTERQYFRDNLWNLSQKEYSGFGVVLGASDMQTSTYIYKKQTLTEGEWSFVFKEAFTNNPTNWIQVYDYVINRIIQRNYYETFGYFNLGNETYWINNVTIDNSTLEGELISSITENIVGNISLHPLFWSFWTGELTIESESHRIVMLKFGD